MIFQNGWAFTGLLLLAVPLLIHLLGRRSARVQPFPTLRFLEPSRLLPVRWTRLTDLPLLAVRLAVLAFAVMALSQPVLITATRRDAGAETIARAIIVDTSASMMRRSPAGIRAVDSARARAQRIADEADTRVITESVEPAASLGGAAAWLEAQPGKHEIVIISDFQRGTMDETDVAALPSGIGLRLIRIDAAAASFVRETVVRTESADLVARATRVDGRTHVEWTARPAPPLADDETLLLLASAAGQSAARSARDAANAIGAPRLPADRAVAIVYRQYENRDDLLGAAQPIDQPWMGEAIARLHADPLLRSAAAVAGDDGAVAASDSVPAFAARSSFVVVARNGRGDPAVSAARGRAGGRDRLLLFLEADAGSIVSAALIAAAARAVTPSLSVAEVEPETIADDVLADWTREPARRAMFDRASASDGRWLWIVALALLALETWMRRTRGTHQTGERGDVV